VEIYVTLASEERVPARLIGDDHWTDLAIIQLNMDEVKKKKITFTSAELGKQRGIGRRAGRHGVRHAIRLRPHRHRRSTSRRLTVRLSVAPRHRRV